MQKQHDLNRGTSTEGGSRTAPTNYATTRTRHDSEGSRPRAKSETQALSSAEYRDERDKPAATSVQRHVVVDTSHHTVMPRLSSCCAEPLTSECCFGDLRALRAVAYACLAMEKRALQLCEPPRIAMTMAMTPT